MKNVKIEAQHIEINAWKNFKYPQMTMFDKAKNEIYWEVYDYTHPVYLALWDVNRAARLV